MLTVPVRFTASRWSDKYANIENWLVDELGMRYRVSPPASLGLIRAGLLIPVLDGLDEMDLQDKRPNRAKSLVREINVWRYGSRPAPLILTCRQEQYNALRGPEVSSGSDGILVTNAATVTLADLAPSQAVKYIYDRVPDRKSWQPVIQKLRDIQDNRLAASLDSPWRLTLATLVYGGALGDVGDGAHRRSPRELLEHIEDMDDHLLRDYVRAATASHPPPRQQFGWQDAERWLTELAVYLDDNSRTGRVLRMKAVSGTDMVLHELWPFAGVRRVRCVDTLLAAMISIPGFVWFAAFTFSRGALWTVLFFAVLVGYAAALWRITRKSSQIL